MECRLRFCCWNYCITSFIYLNNINFSYAQRLIYLCLSQKRKNRACFLNVVEIHPIVGWFVPKYLSWCSEDVHNSFPHPNECIQLEQRIGLLHGWRTLPDRQEFLSYCYLIHWLLLANDLADMLKYFLQLRGKKMLKMNSSIKVVNSIKFNILLAHF